ncbi:NnrS family protein [Falsiroseomonas selenitidurans]|uniref:NnrS family protein n=1 Tax=Falsiroseomonas selenitidurans TaxID=2716335 RepID=A0ABX1EDV0_9PROT|nr:NnrS family protein [Falsiroseomonas selenitidurans]NKC34062.1 NnrS family protein [Falsiroseomonas selenitidurans]
MALFAHGFRPFFLMAGLVAPTAIGVWALTLAGFSLPEGPLPPMRWHAHEALGGFVAAAMIGFLMTAIPNWTGRRGYSGAPLVALATVFLAARFAMLPGSPVPIEVAALLALAPLPATLLLVLPALLKAKAPRLFGPPALVLVFWSGQLMMLADEAGWWTTPGWAAGQLLMANVALLLVVLIGGRIVPSFTLNALRKTSRPAEAQPLPGVDRGAILAVAAVAVVDLAAPGGILAGLAAVFAAAMVALRLSRWHGLRTLRWPILWVLHLAYALIPLALAVKATSLLAGAHWASGWLHLQMAGAVALMVVAVMTRATLGHTGNALVAAPAAVAAYVLLLAAALLRVFGSAALADPLAAQMAAAVLWVLAFLLFLAAYAPMLVLPRADGKPG